VLLCVDGQLPSPGVVAQPVFAEGVVSGEGVASFTKKKKRAKGILDLIHNSERMCIRSLL